MTQSNQLVTAKTAAELPQILCTDKDLSTAAEHWNNIAVMAIDTEFVRERTYFAALGLIQISDGITVWLLDPLKITDFQPLKDLFTNPEILKILHSPSEDLEILLQYFGCLPEPMFDSQLAAAALGQPLQISYQKLLQWQLDIEIDKGETRSNWLQRPLRESQLHYAAMDVSYLPLVYSQLTELLNTRDRYHWVMQDSQLQLDKARQIIDRDTMYFKYKDAWRLNDKQQAVLQGLYKWREEVAINRDLPRSFVVRDNDLNAIARALPDSVNTLKDCTDLHPNALRRHGEKILQLVANKSADGHPQSSFKKPPMPLDSEEKACLQELKIAIINIASKEELDPASLASRRELEALIRARPLSEIPAKFSGWRKALLANELNTINNLK